MARVLVPPVITCSILHTNRAGLIVMGCTIVHTASYLLGILTFLAGRLTATHEIWLWIIMAGLLTYFLCSQVCTRSLLPIPILPISQMKFVRLSKPVSLAHWLPWLLLACTTQPRSDLAIFRLFLFSIRAAARKQKDKMRCLILQPRNRRDGN